MPVRQILAKDKETTSDRGTHHWLQAPKGLRDTARRHCLYPSQHKLGVPPPKKSPSHYFRGCQQPRPLIISRQRSAVNILYWVAYHKIGLRRAYLTPMTSPLYRFTEDSVILKGTIKIIVTLGEPPRMATVMIDFLVVKCSIAFNGVLGRPLLKALKVATSIHCLTIKFPTTTRIG